MIEAEAVPCMYVHWDRTAMAPRLAWSKAEVFYIGLKVLSSGPLLLSWSHSPPALPITLLWHPLALAAVLEHTNMLPSEDFRTCRSLCQGCYFPDANMTYSLTSFRYLSKCHLIKRGFP